MTQEEKQLLLKDLCARLNYGVKIHIELNCTTPNDIVKLIGIDIENFIYDYSIGYLNVRTTIFNHLGELTFKPYLRPISSMTVEEKKEIGELLDASIEIDSEGNISYFSGCDFIPCSDYQIYIDYLNSHHFDYRGLIPKGLALKAPEDMYKNI